jgi:hypothetical protein
MPLMANRPVAWGSGGPNQPNQWAPNHPNQQQNQMSQNTFGYQQGPTQSFVQQVILLFVW